MAIGLALSGGGLRATLFHLGVVRALRDANVLKDVTRICSVSGGSILAAHLVLNWEDYLGDGFDKRAKEILDFCTFDVRNHIFRRYPNLMARWFAAKLVPFLVKPKGATDLLQKYYGRLYGDATLDQLRAPKGSVRPVLHILTTNLTTGTLCSFGTDGFHGEAAAATGRRPQARVHITAATPTLCFAVGASSAFPGMFSPLRLTAAVLGKYDAALEPAEQFVTDGGVYDNLGVRKFLGNPEDLSRLERVYVSNAGLELKTGGGREHVGMIRTALRASDILSHRVHQLESASMASLSSDAAGDKFASMNIREVVSRDEEPEALHENSQDWLRWIRTDLDRFSDFEMHCLIRHGWEVARKSLRKTGATVTSPPWAPFPAASLPDDPVKQMKALSKSVSRRTRLFSLKDRVSWLQTAVVLAVASLGFGVYRARERHVDKLEAMAAEADAKLKIGENLRRMHSQAAEVQHRLAVLIAHRKNKAGTAFKFDGTEEQTHAESDNSEAARNARNATSSYVTLSILQSLLKDPAQKARAVIYDHGRLLLGVFDPARGDHNRIPSDTSADDSKSRQGDWMWKFPGRDFYQIDPSVWCISALNRFLEQPLTESSRVLVNDYYQGILSGLKSFRGDAKGCWLIVEDQKNRDRNHCWAASLALGALLESERSVDPASQPGILVNIRETCRRLVEDWAKEGWQVTDPEGRWRTAEGLTLFTYASLIRVALRDREMAGLPGDMIADIRRRIEAIGRPGYQGRDFSEVLRVERRNSERGEVKMTHVWLPWAIDCTHEWYRWLRRYEPMNLREISQAILTLHSLLGLVRTDEIVETEGLAEFHKPIAGILQERRADEER